MEDLYKYEKELYKENYKLIGGVDEVGRGPLVGPVVAACCVLPEDFYLEGLTDSKKLSEKKRDTFFEYIKEHAIAYGIGVVSPERIDEINIYEASRDKMMYELDEKYPEYGFASHKGYPTKKHIEAINKYGLIEGYRKTYGPVKKVLEGINE